MTKTDSPVRAHSEENEGYKAFTKDKRTRTFRSTTAEYSTRNHNFDGEGGEKRRSYNPNFTKDNQLTDRNKRQAEYNRERNFNRESGERTFNRDERGGYNRGERTFGNREGGYNRERTFNREERGGFNRERNFGSGYNKGGYGNRDRNFNREGGERTFNREERSYNHEGGEQHSFNREERGYNRSERTFGNREGGYNRERSFNREGGERNFNREERGGFNRERNFGGGFNRERSFNREGGNRNFNREGGERTFGKGGFGKGAPHSKPRAQRTEGKSYVNTANHYTIENYPSYATPGQDGAIRLNRYISMSGLCSRREADEYITAGSITVNGQVVTELGTKVMPGDVVCHNGEQLQNEKKVYIVMNKPKGFVTTLDDPHADKSVMDLVKNACTERIYPVGRLDKNSVGVLLLTNDGDLAKKLTHPTYEKKKIYQVSLDKHLTRADMEQLILGITLEDGDIAADDICYVEDPKMKNAVGIEIHSGRNRIVRRMFEHLGYHVGKLDRVYFAGLTKQKLKRGEWRFLTEKEVGMLKSGSYE